VDNRDEQFPLMQHVHLLKLPQLISELRDAPALEGAALPRSDPTLLREFLTRDLGLSNENKLSVTCPMVHRGHLPAPNGRGKSVPDMSNRVILVVEDDHDTRVALRQVLEDSGYFVVSAGNGAEGISLLRTMSRPYCVLLDIGLPILNGDEFLSVVQRDPDLATLPVIQMSAGTTFQREGTRRKFDKPLNLKALIDAIEELSVPA
jgi:CheY-like chemotaxis protein